MLSASGKRSLLQCMVPWLQNIELVDLQPQVVIVQATNRMPELGIGRPSGNPVLTGSGWGSSEGTTVVLHNLLYITTKVSGSESVCVSPVGHSVVSTVPPPSSCACSLVRITARRWRTCGRPCVRGHTISGSPSTTWQDSLTRWATPPSSSSRPRESLSASVVASPPVLSVNSSRTSTYVALVFKCRVQPFLSMLTLILVLMETWLSSQMCPFRVLLIMFVFLLSTL